MNVRFKPTIIYVEDNHGDAFLLDEALKVRNHDVELTIMESGDKALHYFTIKATAQDIPPPHCILLDSNLPMVTGVDLIIFLRSCPIYNHTPIYIFASEADYGSLKGRIKVSNESFLNKPHDWNHFIALADLLMRSADANAHHATASTTDSNPEVHATGDLRHTHPRRPA
jgi:CheY-like chemotaxis protein